VSGLEEFLVNLIECLVPATGQPALGTALPCAADMPPSSESLAMNRFRSLSVVAAATALLLPALPAHASCGSASCTLMTDRFAEGLGDPHEGWSVDLRLEAVTQDQLRRGTKDISASQVTGEETIERRTRNLNVVTTVGYGINTDWSLWLRVPVVKRDHKHDVVDENTGLPGETEKWRFTRLADVQAVARRQFSTEGSAFSYALFGGFKLPTGSTKVSNDDGVRAERALQPGSGTVDAIVGVSARQALGLSNAVFGQASLTEALRSDEHYKPGQRTEASIGWSHAYSPTLGAVLQLNLRHKSRDSGAQAEPELSGSTMVDLSPGVTFGIGHASTFYAYVQLPVYQDVNGIQLVPKYALALGWTSDF
jgi:hypothetical protein